MKRFVSFVLVLCSLFVASCSNANKKEVSSVALDSAFKETTIYVGDIVDFEEYDFIVTYDNGDIEIVDYSNIRISNFSTAVAGDFNLTIVYKNKNYLVEYSIVEPELLSCR